MNISLRRAISFLIAALSLVSVVLFHVAAQERPRVVVPVPTPSSQEQERVEVFTEEVRLPVFVRDTRGRFDPSLEADELLVLEDDVPQQVTSVRRIPSSVLLLLDTAGGMNPLMKTNTTRDVAIRLVKNLKEGDRVAAIQFGNRVELIQTWTTQTEEVVRSLNTKLSSGKLSRLSDALTEAATQLSGMPQGSRHLVLITDGVDSSNDKAKLLEAVKQLLAIQATVHVLSYTSMGSRSMKEKTGVVKVNEKRRKNAQDVYDEMFGPETVDPISEEAKQKKRTFTVISVTIDLDPEMRRRREEYNKALQGSERWLSTLSAETGGLIFLPATTEEIIRQGEEVAREIDAQYVVSYKPKRLLATAPKGEYRRVKVVPRRIGLTVRTRLGYVITVSP